MKLITFGRDITSLPEKNILLGYLIYMLGGFLLLMIPASRTGEIDWVDNLFTAVSAVSTTGLATIDIPASYTIFGQGVLLFLIQIGGIGYMTMSSYIIFRITHHADYTQPVMDRSISRPRGMQLQDLVRNIIHFTFILELLGFISFFLHCMQQRHLCPGGMRYFCWCHRSVRQGSVRSVTLFAVSPIIYG